MRRAAEKVLAIPLKVVDSKSPSPERITSPKITVKEKNCQLNVLDSNRHALGTDHLPALGMFHPNQRAGVLTYIHIYSYYSLIVHICFASTESCNMSQDCVTC